MNDQCFNLVITSLPFIELLAHSLPPSPGTVNGFAVSCSFFARIVSPIVSGYILSWSVEVERPYPLNYNLVFVSLAIACLCGFICILFVPKSFNKQLESHFPPDEPEWEETRSRALSVPLA